MSYNLYYRAKNLCQKTDKNTHTENGNVKVTPAKGKQTYQNNHRNMFVVMLTHDYSFNRKLLLSTQTATTKRSLEQSRNSASTCQNAKFLKLRVLTSTML